jgi:intein/homing endonuclease
MYATFSGTGLHYWLKDPDHELFVKNKGWTQCSELSVGDRTVFGEISFIGTIEEIRNFLGGNQLI